MSSSSRGQVPFSNGPIVRSGHLRKFKTLKKKYFVLRGDGPGHPACLEYYDSKKKFDNRQPPKRSISMRSCFNINRRVDTKHSHVIALYTKDECFSLILDNERELEQWLNAMLLLSGDVPDGEQPRPTFEHVWQVTMQKKGLGERKNIHGLYRLCLTDRTLSLVKVGDNSYSIEFSLGSIRRCGYMDRIFYMEVGRSSVTGGGDLWMEAEDNNIAYNMHSAILSAMSSSNSNNTTIVTGNNSIKDDVGPRQRGRSSSANEASKPISVLQRRHTGAKLHGHSPLEEQRNTKEQMDPLREQNITASDPSQCSQSQSTSSSNTLTGATGRDRCDSLPSRARTTSEGHPTPVVLGHPRNGHLAPHVPRPHSMYGRGLSYSPPVSSMPISPASGACSTDSAGSSLSMDDGTENILEEGTTSSRYGHSLTPDEPVILEENPDDYAPWSGAHPQHKYSPNFKSHSPSQQSSYVEMYSPCGSSPGRGGTSAYMPMSPATGAVQQQHSHSRASSLVEETTLPDGYVPMAPMGDDGYVDMDPSNSSSHHNHNGHFPDDMSQHGGSSCSVTSGTPSTDLRFSEYHLDKVTSYLAPGEENSARPTRAYSVGSRPEPASRHRKNRFDIAQQESSRVRAFSVGSRSKRPEIIGRLASVIASRLPSGIIDCSNSNKSNSAPLLSSSWGHNSGCSVTSERMEDLMELDFTRPNPSQEAVVNSPPSSSCSHSQSYSTATDTSSYVDMSPGQPHSSTSTIPTATTVTAPYVDMSGINKINRNNNNNNSSHNNNNTNTNNNNNNTTTANHNHNQATTSVSLIVHKPVIKTLKPVEETEGAYMRMERSIEDWSRAGTSPKQAPSPMQDDYMQMNGPPGGTRTAPVDLPQPRRPPEGYVEMSFKSRPSLEQEYMNMNMGSGGSTGSGSTGSTRTRTRRQHPGSRTEKSQRSKPIAIQMSSKTTKIPCFLPLNGSPTSESLASTPVSPPRATPTGSNVTIFPFSLNSPQSPIKPFKAPALIKAVSQEDSGQVGSTTTLTTSLSEAIPCDYAMMTPGIPSTSGTSSTTSLQMSISQPNQDEITRLSSSSVNTLHEVPQSPLTKRLAELTLSRTKINRNPSNPAATVAPSEGETNPIDKTSINLVDNMISCFRLSNQSSDPSHSPVTKRRGGEITFSKMKTSRASYPKDETNLPSTSSSYMNKTSLVNNCDTNNGPQGIAATATTTTATTTTTTGLGQNSQSEMPTSPLTKRLCELSVAKAKLVQPSPNTSPTPSAGFKIIQTTPKSLNSGTTLTDEDRSGGTTPTTTPTPTPSPLDSEGYEKLQPGATILHYASLDLPEVVGPPPPVSPTPIIEAFNYAEIDFAKLKQN